MVAKKTQKVEAQEEAQVVVQEEVQEVQEEVQEVKYTLAISMLGFKKGQEVKPSDFTEYSFKHWLATGAIIKK